MAVAVPHPERKYRIHDGALLFVVKTIHIETTVRYWALTASAVAAASPIAGKRVFAAAIVSGIADMAAPIPRLIGLEMVEPLRSVLRKRPMVSVARIKAIVDVAIKAARSVEPGAGSEKHAANKPVGAIVAVGGAIVRGVIEIPVGANRGRSNVDADGDLGWRCGRKA